MTGTQRRVTGLVAVATWLAIDLVRFSGPLISQLFDIGVTLAAGVALATYVGGGLLAFVGARVAREVGYGRVLFWMAAVIVVLRILLPFLAGEALILYGLITLGLALALLLIAVGGTAEAGGGGAVLAAAGIGTMVAAIEQTILHTWDALWRSDLLSWSLTGLLSLALLFGAWRARRDVSERPVRGLWAFGLWFSIVVFAFGNLAFVSSQTGFHLSIALVLVAFGLGAGVYASSRRPNLPMAAVGVAGAGSIFAIWTMVAFSGAVLVVMVPVAISSLTYLASRVVRPAPETGLADLRALGAMASFGLFALLPFMLVQLDYDIPIGIPHLLVIVIAAAGIAVGAVVRSRNHDASRTLAPATIGFRRRAGVALIASIVVSAFTLFTFNAGAPGAGAPPRELRVVSWNLHYGVTPGLAGGPGVELDETVAYLGDLHPDVLLLQEVERGWILAGGTDLLQYLADALDMNYVYAGAHDRQFGNAVLARYPLDDLQVVRLPYGEGPQERSAVLATVETASGPIQFGSIHLQHKDDDQTRVDEVEAFLAEPASDARLIAGDFNDTPDSRAVALMRQAGYRSAQDDLGTEMDTYVGSDFQDRIDYVWMLGLAARDFAVGDSRRSDHLDLFVVVSVE